MTLTVAYWCVLITACLPYVWVYVAKSSGDRFDNRDPRGWMDRQTNPRVHRANAAQLNSFEAFAPFAASVALAQLAGVDEERIASLAVAFVALRVIHGVVYIAGIPSVVRSLAWALGFACVVALLAMAALRVG